MTWVSIFRCFSAVHSKSTKDLCVPLTSSRATYICFSSQTPMKVLCWELERAEKKPIFLVFLSDRSLLLRIGWRLLALKAEDAAVHILIRAHGHFCGSGPALGKAARLDRCHLEAMPYLAQQNQRHREELWTY